MKMNFIGLITVGKIQRLLQSIYMFMVQTDIK